MSTEKLMPYNEKDVTAIWSLFARTRESVADDVDAIKHWLKTQPHIPGTLPDDFIRNFLRINKCSIEHTKQTIDYYYTSRHFIPELFTHHPLSPEMLESYKVWYFVCLPKRVNLQRVTVFKMADDDPEKLNMEHLFSHTLNFAEIRMLHDCVYKDIYVFDLSGTRAAHLLKIPLMLLRKFILITDQVYSSRVGAVHVINGFETILGLIRSVLKPKIRNRLYIHKSYDSLHKYVPKEVLPEDLKGQEMSLEGLKEIQLKCFEEMKERFDVLMEMKSNEELRPGKPVNDEFLGFYGNFKKIQVD